MIIIPGPAAGATGRFDRVCSSNEAALVAHANCLADSCLDEHKLSDLGGYISNDEQLLRIKSTGARIARIEPSAWLVKWQ